MNNYRCIEKNTDIKIYNLYLIIKNVKNFKYNVWLNELKGKNIIDKIDFFAIST